MDQSKSTYTSLNTNTNDGKQKPPKQSSRKGRGDCKSSEASSHTEYFRKNPYDKVYERITSDQYLGISESISGSSDTFRCVHGPEGKKYTAKGQLKRNLLKELDPIPKDKKVTESCKPVYGWDIAKTIEFMVKDPVAVQQTDRLQSHLRDFSRTASKGFRIDTLESLCVILDYLVESLCKMPSHREGLLLLLKDVQRPVLLNVNSDVINSYNSLRKFISYLGYLMIRSEDDELFDMVAKGLIYQLTAPDSLRGHQSAQLRHTLAAAQTVLSITMVRMLAVTSPHRFPAFLKVALILALDSVDECLIMMSENILENIFYRFNPYFPDRVLPAYDINPANLDDYCVKLGESGVNISLVLSLVMVLLKTIKEYIEDNPGYEKTLPCPDNYAQRCFIWAFRYECRAREHWHQRSCLTIVIHMMIHIFKDRLPIFCSVLMLDIMSLAVLTELPPRNDWTRTVNFNVSQADVLFKRMLIHLSVEFIKIFPYNKLLVESRQWFVGLMYLIDPGLCQLRARWSTVLFAELRKTALQALMLTLRRVPQNIPIEYSIIRRTMWYIEWYSESPYELPVLYWCVRLLQMALFDRSSMNRKIAVRELLRTHGIVVLMHLCLVLIEKKLPPLEKCQAIIGLNLRLLASALQARARVSCIVYPNLKWPDAINILVKKMLDMVLYCLDKHYIVSDRWMISLLNFIWEGVVWRPEYRRIFIANNGVYQLLDLVSMTRYPVQCICLGLLCDIARAGDAVGQLVTWRASFGASYTHPIIVPRGATIATLIAAIFKRDCDGEKIILDENNVLKDLDFPLMSKEVKKYFHSPKFSVGTDARTPNCLAAAELSGSRMSRCYALLHLLTEDLEYKVSLADEAYNLYSNVKLEPQDEVMLVLCSHFLTLKHITAWMEAEIQSPGYVPEDQTILQEFIHVGQGWAKDIRRQQMGILERCKKKEYEHECSLHAFLARVRLNVALDALREVRCVARSADRVRIAHALLADAVLAYHRRSTVIHKMNTPVIRTYGPTLDQQNITGQNVTVVSIQPRIESLTPSSEGTLEVSIQSSTSK